MRKIKMEVELEIPETLQECDLLLSGQPGDDEYSNYLACVGCVYKQDGSQCNHRNILIALENIGE